MIAAGKLPRRDEPEPQPASCSYKLAANRMRVPPSSGLVVVFLLASAACDSSQKKPDGEAPLAEQSLSVREAPAATVLVPTLAGSTIDASARAALSEAGRASVDGSRLPILLPRSLAGRGRLLVEEHWYDFAHRADGTEIHLKGFGVAHGNVPFPQPNGAIAGRAVFENRSEGIASVSFRENGIHYVATIECGGRACDDTSELRAFVGDLVFVGGGVR
jgi:hypothetical protein